MDVLVRMLEAAVVTLREGVEAALVVGLAVAYLGRTGRGSLVRYAYLGLAAAVLASIAGALLAHAAGLDLENEVWEGSAMRLAGALVASLVVWMWRAGRRVAESAEVRLEAAVRGGARGAAVGVFTFTFFTVLREGLEAVLFLTALSGTIGANPVYNAVGGGTGLVLAALFGTLLVRGTIRIDLTRFLRVTGLVLVLLAVKLLANGLHEFFEVGLLPSSASLLRVVGLLTRDTTSALILALLVAAPAAVLLREALGHETAGAGPDETPAEGRRRRAAARASRRRTWAAGATGLVLSVLLAVWTALPRGYDPDPARLAVSGPLLRIPVAELRDHPMRKYTVDLGDVTVRFFLLRGKGGDGGLAVAFDACAICPPHGYLLVGDQLVCRNCGAPISPETVGTPGGCNPVPLEASVVGDEVLIRVEALGAGRAAFSRGA